MKGPIQALALITMTLLPLTAGGQSAQPTADAHYSNALAKETAVRTALKGDLAPEAVRKAVRTVAADYEQLVRNHPTSAHADDALWKAANLYMEAFTNLGEAEDREEAMRLYRMVASEYPTSTYAKQALQAAAAAERAAAAPQPAVAAAERAAPASRAAAPSTERVAPTPNPSVPSAARSSPAPVQRQAPTSPSTSRIALMSGIRRTIVPDAVRVVIELDREVPYREERLANPDRVFVDLSSTRVAPALSNQTLRFDSDSHPVRIIRIGSHPNNTTRVVLETSNVASCSIYPVYAPFQLVIDCIPEGESEATTTPWSAVSSRPEPPTPEPAPPPTLDAGAIGEFVVQTRLQLPAAQPASQWSLSAARKADPPPVLSSKSAVPRTTSLSPMRPPAKNLAGGFSMARQLGLGVSRIVIDPGHGGQDPGAKARGTTEANVVLDIALRLEKLLEEDEEAVEVILTRRADTYVPLEERTAIANREAADLFLSIHANASNIASAAGVETYFLNFATNMSAASVAARENAASGHSMGALPDLVKSIALSSKLDESRDLATFLQRELVAGLKGGNKDLKDLGVKQAPFVVLIGAAMPSALAEISFMTNTQEARLLQSGAYRQRIAEALFSGIRKYQGSLKTVERVASQ
jgi:N-acetylmuramoyl-L-alanine amidase